MQKFLVSIILPTYNSEKTIQAALDSIFCQELKDYELIIIDGASKDTTLDIAKEAIGLVQSEISVTLISEKDEGIYDAINKGILHAQGKWIYILGSDDKLVSSSVLSSFKALVEVLDVQMVYGDVLMKGEIYLGKFDRLKLLHRNICQQAIFYKRELLEQHGLFNPRYKVYADYVYNIEIFFNEKISTGYIPLVVAEYSLDGLSSIEVDEMFVIDYPDMIQNLIKGKVSACVLYEQYAKCGLRLFYKSYYLKGMFYVAKAFLYSGEIKFILMLLPKIIRKPLGIHTFWN